MFKNLARGLTAAMLAAVAAATLTSLPASAQTTAPLKVGFVYVSPIGDAGWTFQHNQGRLAMEKALGAQVSTTAVEAVAEGADSERVMRDLVAQGHKLIFATSFGYLEPALRVAADHPDVVFEHAGGFKTAKNVNTYNARFYEARYLAGLLAGKTSKSGIAGYVAGFPVPEVVQGINAFALGMRAANPKAQVKVVWLNTWFDPPREREAATSLIHQGADVLTNHSGSPAVPQTAQAHAAKGVRVIAYQSDMSRHAPDAQLTAITHQWGAYYTRVAESVRKGTWRALPVWGGMKDGFIALAPFAASVPADVVKLVKTREAEIVQGKLHPFAGRLVDSQGTVRQERGVMDDATLAKMNWFVDGVTGTLPKP
ncbi:BMP family ABC transporter substrate-binding protein [Piscinibacter sp. HJYY11]|uniref:BMP family ABC transporter substrate-binding protein n=1 Tax=Piscinibacter sp. HJYY11 TaxID=2801333 RepID=UPI00191F7617|nr:BMP family ABC transporter substrate-binding protein [Piscinibacter sp. HJYY11]MBL0727495.1 BMP family ABC transporter substrate-binding protein [Piscinibacter sp. HJYY11]